MPGATEASRERKRRLKWGPIEPATETEVVWAGRRPELKNVGQGDEIKLLLNSPEWAKHMAPLLDAIDRDREKRRGPKPDYTAQELESVIFFWQTNPNAKSIRDALKELSSFEHKKTREAMGFIDPRGKRLTGELERTPDELPSRATLYRHWKRIPSDRRARRYQRVLDAIRAAELPHADPKKARTQYVDGSKMSTHCEVPKYKPLTTQQRQRGKRDPEWLAQFLADRVPLNFTKKHRITGADVPAITCPEGGYVPWSAGPDKSGRGFDYYVHWTADGLPLSEIVDALNVNEHNTVQTALDRYEKVTRPHLPFGPDQLATITADSGVAGDRFRARARTLGMVESVQRSSHSSAKTSKSTAYKRTQRRYPIEHPRNANWHINGHHELMCACGSAAISRRFSISPTTGESVVATEGSCVTCGQMRLQSGRWRMTTGSRRKIVKCLPEDTPDWSIGNPLTFHDKMAAELGRGRFGHNEGFHAMVAKTYGILNRRYYLRSKADAEQGVYATHIAIYLRHRLRRRAITVNQLVRKRMRIATWMGIQLKAGATR